MTFIQTLLKAFWRWFRSDFNTLSTWAAIVLMLAAIVIIVGGFSHVHHQGDGPSVGIMVYPRSPRPDVSMLIADLYANGGAELLGIAITVLIIEQLNRRRANRERKEELILSMGSDEKVIAKEAVRVLRLRGWLEDGSLRGANLRKANLTEADLQEANLSGVRLAEANLEGTNLELANLSGAYMVLANLTRAYLSEANLNGANLENATLAGSGLYSAKLNGVILENAKLTAAILVSADLEEANLRAADLSKADLRGANLRRVWLNGANLANVNLCGADLTGANVDMRIFAMRDDAEDAIKCDEDTILPNGEKWQPKHGAED